MGFAALAPSYEMQRSRREVLQQAKKIQFPVNAAGS